MIDALKWKLRGLRDRVSDAFDRALGPPTTTGAPLPRDERRKQLREDVRELRQDLREASEEILELLDEHGAPHLSDPDTSAEDPSDASG